MAQTQSGFVVFIDKIQYLNPNGSPIVILWKCTSTPNQMKHTTIALHRNPLKFCYESLGIHKERPYKLFNLSLFAISLSYYFSSQIECAEDFV